MAVKIQYQEQITKKNGKTDEGDKLLFAFSYNRTNNTYQQPTRTYVWQQ